jgi:hypothetical protein
MEGRRLKVFENRVLKREFGRRRNAGECVMSGFMIGTADKIFG